MKDYDMLQSLALGSGWTVLKNNILDNPFLELKYTHYKCKKKDYIVCITVKTQQENSNVQYEIVAHMQRWNETSSSLECVVCENIEDVIEKVKCLAYQYQKIYTSAAFPNYIPIKIPAGWEIVLNSFVKETIDIPFGQPFCSCDRLILSEKFNWERDISAFKWDCIHYEIFVELQEYTSENALASLLCVHVYFNKKDGITFFEELENVFCFSIEEAQEKINQFLWKYKDGLN